MSAMNAMNQISGGKNRIVWAVNPFADDVSVMSTTLDAVTENARAFEGEVIPVCVWRTSGIESGLAIGQEDQERYWDEGRKLVADLLKDRGILSRPLEILAGPYLTLRDGISDLLEFARHKGADLIAVAGRSREGGRNWLLGSFSEALSTHSDIPLLIVPPQAKLKTRFGSVLFTTDFSQECFSAYQDLVEQARIYGWSITIYHHVVFYYPVFDYAFIPPQIHDQTSGEEIAARKKDMDSLIDYAFASGVRARSHLDHSVSGNTAEMILHHAKKEFDLIAMASRTGPIQGALLGSTVRRVIRESPIPIWVIHPRVKSRVQTEHRSGAAPRFDADPSPREEEHP